MIRNLDEGLIADYKQAAINHGRSLEAELREVLGAVWPKGGKDCATLLRLSDEALTMTPPAGPDPTSDSMWGHPAGSRHRSRPEP